MRSGWLPVSGGHSIYYEVHGHGRPAVILHGGPGGAMNRNYLSSYDLKKWCVVMFDQRGCGKSTPFGCLEHNTTWDLVEDMEALRIHCGFDKWFVSGGSWGTTLGLVYAETHPSRVTGLLLRGVCLLNEASQEWLYQEGGASCLFPDEWAKFISVLPPRLHHKGWREIMEYYQGKLQGSDKGRYADAWWGWEDRLSQILPVHDDTTKKGALALALLENHYFVHDGWLTEGQIIKNASRLRNIPITIVHGRHDTVCPIEGAYKLKKALPHARMHVVEDAGHSFFEKGIGAALRRSAKQMRGLVSKTRKKR